MGNKFRIIRERIRTMSLFGKTWRLVSMVRERIVTRSEIKRREQTELESRKRAERELKARIIKTL